MAWKGIKHIDVGEELDSAEFHSEELHELDSGTELPTTPNDYDLFIKIDEKHLYINIPEGG